MTFELKSISKEAIPEALEKVERYRLLNEPSQAESICLDILRIDPENQQALVWMLLSMTDQFGEGVTARQAREVLPRLKSEYDRAYYSGIISERAAKAQMKQGGHGTDYSAFESIRGAMECYERAEALRRAGNDDAVLRWNTCARILMRNPNLKPRPAETFEPVLGE